MVTLFLATVLGWYLVIFSLFLLLRRDAANTATNDIMTQRGSLLIVAIITLLCGLLMVVSHNVWVMGWPVVVTLMGWLVLISGIIRLFFPEMAIGQWKRFVNHPYAMTIVGIIFLLIGLFLIFNVYYVSL